MGAISFKVVANEQCLIGYVPRYYSEAVLHFLRIGRIVTCHIVEIGEEHLCDICIRADLSIEP